MPVQNNNSKIYALPDLTVYLLQMLIPTSFYSILCKKKGRTINISVMSEMMVSS